MSHVLFGSLKGRLAAFVVSMFISAIWILTYLTTISLRSDMHRLLADQQFSAVSYVADDIEQRVQMRFDGLAVIASEISPALLQEPAKLHDMLSHRPLLGTLFGIGVTVISKSGKPVTASPASTFNPTITFSEIEYFQQVMATGKPAVGKPRIGRVSHKPVMAFAVPILAKNGEIIGVLAGYALLSDPSLFGALENAKVGNKGWIAISAPAYKLIVSSSDQTRILDKTAEPGVNKAFDRFVDGFEGTDVSINSRGIETLTSAKQIPSAGWFAQAVLPTSEAFLPVNNLIAKTYGIAATLSILVAMLAWVIIRKMLHPLAETSRQIEAMALGNKPLSAIHIDREDEIGTLQNGFNTLVHARNEIEACVQAQSEKIELLSHHLISAQEEERRRLALSIHDITGPNLAAIKIQMKMISEDLLGQDDHDIKAKLEDVKALVEDTETSLRGICAELRPPALDYNGLAPALKEYAQQFSIRTGIPVRTSIDESTVRLPTAVESKLFRIAQEAMTNSAKHAHPSHIDIKLSHGPDSNELSITDDGAGFDLSELSNNKLNPGLGLLTMRERAEFIGGQFSIESAPGHGTRIAVTVASE